MEELVRAALDLDKYSIARLISIFEDTRPAAAQSRVKILEQLSSSRRKAVFIGITGTPGAGKSTLTGELTTRIIRQKNDLAAAVLAIDPSSEISGGSILGDRTRVRFPLDEKRLFFRSQASDLELGGVGRHTFQVCRVLFRLFDIVFIETVGIGQSELEIQHVADRTYLVLQPMAGDQIQFMKAGIMEIPDVFVLNKADEARAAHRSLHALKASLAFARPGEEEIPVLKTSALTGEGVDELAEDILTNGRNLPMAEKEEYFFSRWVRDEFGRTGLRILNQGDGSSGFIKKSGSYDLAQKEFQTRFREWL